jgi:hypothetical protein
MDEHGRVTGLRVERTQLQIPEGSKAAVAVGTGGHPPLDARLIASACLCLSAPRLADILPDEHEVECDGILGCQHE